MKATIRRTVLAFTVSAACVPLAAASALPAGTAPATPCSVTTFARAGTLTRDKLKGKPGLVLSGGGFSQAPSTQRILPWIREHLQGAGRRGNLVVLKASGGRDYSADFFKNSALASIQEILIPPCAAPADVDRVAEIVQRADAVLFAGGDQANYVIWKGGKLIEAVRGVYARGGVVGGGSAGLAIQGEVIFDSVADDRYSPDKDVASADAVKDPYERIISFTTGMFSWPALRNTITDTHFVRRDRFGRTAAFMARIMQDRLTAGDRVYDVAVDEGEALLVDDRGVATLVRRDREDDGYVPRGAYFLQGGRPAKLFAGQPLQYTVHVTHIARAGQKYDLRHHRGSGTQYNVTVDGSAARMYSRDPYR
ncbi:MAG: Type 1 glutamine amidotransferase-like domain-containing protein [Candidatus Eremiobacteraeota bacterium]|nr:Type 1 glutamine amidotransferase-like domain-containing protein [Candidatus Eremiobacteraeota bacterium]